ncbi:Uncharacterised protein [Vibrio cholerae]|nr:Uncharacterised protein [Vibrio cholerae]
MLLLSRVLRPLASRIHRWCQRKQSHRFLHQHGNRPAFSG